jgi:hypothetical protein
MIPINGESTNGIVTAEEKGGAADSTTGSSQQLEVATRAKLRGKQQFQQNRFVIFAAGAVVLALLIFVALSMPHKTADTKPKTTISSSKETPAPTTNEKSLIPITDSGRPPAPETHQGFLDERDLERSATRRPQPVPPTTTAQSSAPGSLGSIPPFGGDQQWQAPPYQPGSPATNGVAMVEPGRAERDSLEKSSLIYVRNVSASPSSSPGFAQTSVIEPEIGLGLTLGTRLRAHLESAASTAVRAPVLAVIEYNYEREGQIVVPAGAKAVGHLQEANRSGYVRIQFDSLLMPDGSSVPIQAVATTLDLRPPKGRVEGKNAGKNALVRSLSGIGEAGAILVGRGNMSQPLNESDLIRERISNNIGEAGDQEVSQLAVNQQIVVTIPANTEIYVVLEQTPKPSPAAGQPDVRAQSNPNVQQLRELLQLQRELDPANNANR